MDQFEFDNRKIVCQKCGGVPIELIEPGWPYPMVCVACRDCGHAGPKIYFAQENANYHSAEHQLLPDLAGARRQAAAAWNEQPRERTYPGRGTVV